MIWDVESQMDLMGRDYSYVLPNTLQPSRLYN